METFTQKPTWGAQMSTEPSLFEAKFGEGYEQSTPNGINHMLEEWQLQFENIRDAVYFDIKAFLRRHKGSEPFQWTTPDGETLYFRCKSWSGSPPSYGVRNMTLKFRQVMI